MQVSPTKALRLYKVSKPTLYQDMKTGKLSFSKTPKGRRQIDVAELDRVYSKREEGTNDNQNQNETLSNVRHPDNSVSEKLYEKQIQLLHDQLQFKDQMIDEWKGAFEKAQRTADKITALIEHQSESRGDNKEIDDLKETVQSLVNQNRELLKKEEERKRAREAKRKRDLEKQAEIKRLEEESWRRGLLNKIKKILG